MKKLLLLGFLLNFLISFGQEKDYSFFFENCNKMESSSMCAMLKIETEIQELYKIYRNSDAENYDTEKVKIQYTILKNGKLRLDTIDGNIEQFKIVIKNFFKKLPKTKPIHENSKPRDAMMTSTFYLYPKTKK